MRFASFLAALSLVSSSLHARLGDTERDCITRYGSPVASNSTKILGPLVPGTVERSYSYQGWKIRVAFVNGVAVAQEYRKDVSVLKAMKITDDELAAILEGESGGAKWSPARPKRTGDIFNQIAQELMGSVADGRLWSRPDGATAHIDHACFHIRLTTPASEAAKAAASAQKKVQQRNAIPAF